MKQDQRLYVTITVDALCNPKVAPLSPYAKLLMFAALIVARRDMTDGAVRPQAVIAEASLGVKAGNRGITELHTAGILHDAGHDCSGCPQPPTPGWLQIHDYLKHQTSRADVEELRKARSAAGRKGARARWGDDSSDSNSHSKSHSNSHSTPHGKRIWQTYGERERERERESVAEVVHQVPVDRAGDYDDRIVSATSSGFAADELNAAADRQLGIEAIMRKLDCDEPWAEKTARRFDALAAHAINDHAAFYGTCIADHVNRHGLDSLLPTPIPKRPLLCEHGLPINTHTRCDRCEGPAA